MGRVWIYIIGKALSAEELRILKEDGENFVRSWTAHENKLSGSFEIFKNRIIIVRVDEKIYEASGCSIDKLTRFIREEEKKFGFELMNRLLVAVKKNEEVDVVHSSKIKDLLENGTLNENSIIYNTSVSNTGDLLNWEQPLKNTWLKKYIPVSK